MAVNALGAAVLAMGDGRLTFETTLLHLTLRQGVKFTGYGQTLAEH
jgi:hypothetical protein